MAASGEDDRMTHLDERLRRTMQIRKPEGDNVYWRGAKAEWVSQHGGIEPQRSDDFAWISQRATQMQELAEGHGR